MVDFGCTLKRLRLQSGMTQKQLADKMGVTKAVISYYELQERYPSPEILIKLASIFHVSTDYLLGLERTNTVDLSELSDSDVLLVKQLVESLRQKNS